MEIGRLEEILSGFSGLSDIVVAGDFFLDDYVIVDPVPREVSDETGFPVCHVIGQSQSPGAAGNVCLNIAALGVRVEAIGVIGRDGRGMMMESVLRCSGVSTTWMAHSTELPTGAYIKRMHPDADGRPIEVERLDVKWRSEMPLSLQDEVSKTIERIVGHHHTGAMVAIEQVQERGRGFFTDAVRDAFVSTAMRNPGKMAIADSKANIGLYGGIIVKPNEVEAERAVGTSGSNPEANAWRLHSATSSPVAVTLGDRGSMVVDGKGVFRAPAVAIDGPIDIVGAGDTWLASFLCSKMSGASWSEACLIGNVAASVSLRKLGTTGTATKDEIIEAFASAEFR